MVAGAVEVPHENEVWPRGGAVNDDDDGDASDHEKAVWPGGKAGLPEPVLQESMARVQKSQ